MDSNQQCNMVDAYIFNSYGKTNVKINMDKLKNRKLTQMSEKDVLYFENEYEATDVLYGPFDLPKESMTSLKKTNVCELLEDYFSYVKKYNYGVFLHVEFVDEIHNDISMAHQIRFHEPFKTYKIVNHINRIFGIDIAEIVFSYAQM